VVRVHPRHGTHGIRGSRRRSYDEMADARTQTPAHLPSPGRRTPTGWRSIALVAVVAAMTGCDIPTELPRFDTVWEAVLLRDSVSTLELLPDGVSVHPDGGFAVDSFVTTTEVQIEDVCEFCTCFEGPIPALDIQPYDWPFQLPSRVLEAEVSEGIARVVLHNEAGFDVLDDGAGNVGHLKIDFFDTRSRTVLDSVRISQPFPDGDSLTVQFDLGGLTVASSLVARVSGRIPGSGCDTIDLSTDGGFRADVRLLGVRTPSVVVLLSNADLNVAGRNVDLPDALVDRLRPGDADVVLEVQVEARLPVETELLISAASHPDLLFTEDAALYTPLVLPASDGDAVTLREAYVLDVARIQGADQIFIDSRNRIIGNAVVELDGGESVSYQITLHGRIPSR